MKKSVIQIINEKIIEKLEKGVNPWRKTWITSGGVKLNVPANYISNKSYSGINFALLEPGYYLTYKQAKSLGGNVKQGASGYMVIYSAPYEKEDETGEKKQGFAFRYYYVFKIEDCENIKEIKNRPKLITKSEYSEILPVEKIEEIINDYAKREKLTVEKIEQSRAFYRPSTDTITLPLIKQFKNTNEYYSTVFHEIAHSTGHPKRLNREGIAQINYFGSEKYSKEELIAEITSAYCMNYCNLETNQTLENSVAYLKNWAENLKGNTSNYFIMNSTTQAEKAYQMIVNK